MLSKNIELIESQYDAIVIGSGYGGGVTASRLSRSGLKVCLLERGKEFEPGEFPDAAPEALREMQGTMVDGHVGSYTGLYDFRYFRDMTVFQGCGLGGTSLVNANVSLRLDPRIFEDTAAWPSGLLGDMDTLNACYEIAERMLQPETLPARHEGLKKFQAHKRSAQDVIAQPEFRHGKFEKTPINVTFDDGVNAAGVPQKGCNLCGDCVSGCNHTSKNTTYMNYLPDAVKHGAHIFCEVSVRHLERQGDEWLVHYRSTHAGSQPFGAALPFVRAKLVIVSAGTLGSTELMLRSREQGLVVSPRLGEDFSGNGDVLAFGYNCDTEISGVGFGDHDPAAVGGVGPCITGVIDLRGANDMEEGFVIEEGSIPGALGPVLPEAFAAGAALYGVDTDDGIVDWTKERYRTGLSWLRGPYKGAVDNTQTYLVMSHDGSSGAMTLEDDRLSISWPGVGDRPLLKKYERAMIEATRSLGGTYMKNPLTNKLLHNNQVTVHPLGGCCMGESLESGVVNHKGQVFGADGEVYPGLYISDGSVLPRSVGVNPLLTITAVTERMCRYLVHDHFGKEIPLEGVGPIELPEMDQGDRVGIRFTERMAGHFALGATDYEAGAEAGKAAGNEGAFEFVLTIVSRDLDKMLSDPNHAAKMYGSVVAPALSPSPLSATNGTFELLVKDENDPDVRYMRYQMELISETGQKFAFEGHKVIRDDRGLDLWADTTTLYVTVSDMEKQALGKGILTIAPADFLKQLQTVKPFNTKNIQERLGAVVRFSKFFTEQLWEVY